MHALAMIVHCVQMGLRTLRCRAAAVLLAIGIGVGVAVVTVVLSLAADYQARLGAGLPDNPDRLLLVSIVESVANDSGSSGQGFMRDDILTLATMPGVDKVATEVQGASVGLSRESAQSATIRAVAGPCPEMQARLTQGRLPIAVEPGTGAERTGLETRECAVSKRLASTVYGPGGSPVGRSLKVLGQDFDVVGVIDPPVDRAAWDYMVLVPASALPGGSIAGELQLWATDAQQVDAVSETVRSYARDHMPGTVLDIVAAAEAYARAMDQARRGGRQAVVFAGAILLVASINVMNLSLVQVASRMREMGLRRALGATKGALAVQVALECATVSLTGGAAGLLLAAAVSSVMGRLGLPIRVTAPVYIEALGFLIAVSLLTSLPVAWRAGQVDPQRALWSVN